jgi:hypothetical protein
MKGRVAELLIILASARVKSTFFLPSLIYLTFLARSKTAFSSLNSSSQSISRYFSMHAINYFTSDFPGLKRFFKDLTRSR